ncbi:hypothetical protein HYFRA_00004368 [Hymenoscyphus fraxineus]|uniref:Gfd2/YDR514C-like C-terminal domain-containing protein n=1 Tax=Hymenoscyphus fraxineus TaxID=746836 RepID=A0A9N9KMI0_9HELO|nr:hypothetical protein HYFRA_00004368 [Hymenoscyphus fraxineus]
MALGIDFPRNGLEQLQTIFGLGLSKIPWDVIFVSFDLECGIPDFSAGHISEIGISMLDMRHFSPENPPRSLETLHFVVGGNKRLVHCARRFHFGTSKHLDGSAASVNEAIIKLLHIPDERSSDCQRFRDIVLVGHGLRSDLYLLRQRGIMYANINTIVAKLDTTYIAREVLGVGGRLPSLLKILQCPYENCHTAGNDANFALRALLILSYYGLREYATSPAALRMLESFKNLALDPLPDIRKRNALIRASKIHREDHTMYALDQGDLSFSEGSNDSRAV